MMYVNVCVYTIFNHAIRCILVDILWISQLGQLWTLIYNHPNHSIFFCHQKHSTQKFLQQFSSRYIYIYIVYIFLSNQNKFQNTTCSTWVFLTVLRALVPLSERAFLASRSPSNLKSTGGKTCDCEFSVGFFVALLPCVFFSGSFQEISKYIVISF